MARTWDDPDPWNVVARPILWVLMRLNKPLYESPPADVPESQPEPPILTTRFCKDCKTETTHREYFWVLEQATTYECTECEGVWVNG